MLKQRGIAFHHRGFPAKMLEGVAKLSRFLGWKWPVAKQALLFCGKGWQKEQPNVFLPANCFHNRSVGQIVILLPNSHNLPLHCKQDGAAQNDATIYRTNRPTMPVGSRSPVAGRPFSDYRV